jgi:hypothetical protein
MDRRSVFRLAVVSLAALGLNGCGSVQNDGYMFQRWAAKVAEIPVTAEDAARRNPELVQASVEADRPPVPRGGLAIQVVDSLDLPQARADGLRAVLQTIEPATAAVGEQASGLRGLIGHSDAEAPEKAAGRLVQLAAFPSEAAAKAAVKALRSAHPDALRGVPLRFERADLGEKGVWTRVKAEVSTRQQAEAVCAAARAGKWCAAVA